MLKEEKQINEIVLSQYKFVCLSQILESSGKMWPFGNSTVHVWEVPSGTGRRNIHFVHLLWSKHPEILM